MFYIVLPLYLFLNKLKKKIIRAISIFFFSWKCFYFSFGWFLFFLHLLRRISIPRIIFIIIIFIIMKTEDVTSSLNWRCPTGNRKTRISYYGFTILSLFDTIKDLLHRHCWYLKIFCNSILNWNNTFFFGWRHLLISSRTV